MIQGHESINVAVNMYMSMQDCTLGLHSLSLADPATMFTEFKRSLVAAFNLFLCRPIH